MKYAGNHVNVGAPCTDLILMNQFVRVLVSQTDCVRGNTGL